MGGKFVMEFEFPESFGFTGSSKGPVNPKPQQGGSDTYGDGTYLSRQAAQPQQPLAKGGRVHGGHMPGGGHEKAIPVPKVAKAVAGALQVGKAIGQKQGALNAAAPPAAAPAPAMGAPALGQPAMRRGGKVRRFADGGDVDDQAQADSQGGPVQASAQPPWLQGVQNKMAGQQPQQLADGGQVDAPRPIPRPMYGDEDMGDVERNNYDVLLHHSNKNWTPEEARDMATNPSGRLPSIASQSRRAATGPADYDPNVDSVNRDMMAARHKPAAKAKGGFIKGAIKKPGQLHKDLGVPQGQKIPAGKLPAAAKRPGKVGQRARLAETLGKMKR